MSGMLESLQALLLASLPMEPAFHAGRVHGGWSYIWFSFGLAWFSLLAYAFYLLRLRKQLQTLPPEDAPMLPPAPSSVPPEGELPPASAPPEGTP
jgi:hypothetical protein